jgi:hypothetical protein
MPGCPVTVSLYSMIQLRDMETQTLDKVGVTLVRGDIVVVHLKEEAISLT